jgi:hypothetical protein
MRVKSSQRPPAIPEASCVFDVLDVSNSISTPLSSVETGAALSPSQATQSKRGMLIRFQTQSPIFLE